MMISLAITLGISTAIALIWVNGIIDYHPDERPVEGREQEPGEENRIGKSVSNS